MLLDLGILDLALLEDLNISVPEEKCIPMGVVHKIIDPLVFDVFGQVSKLICTWLDLILCSPLLNKAFRLEWNMEVYFASRTRHSAFVFIDALLKQKGSDASWDNDQEPPEECLDYSDDEQERRAKAAHRLKKNLRGNAEE
ncbi:hypothetical protein DAPPUDRAFT_322388 [Daphnia pulex]|uniref:Uncharacterized protein n=1 Tax=Daphnia pulex TaxID=6669 RepID=E9GVS5_DAPPU|nr:hypothetical protein DAPPUDRAFT_322388 [Daphnia pulex]|eukprot:EFX76462.1 hypothetical protein DAPPUDRAFT_322388 [Daphnia pulex]